MAIVFPAMVIEPDRAPPAFAATVIRTEPLPEPVAADATAIHEVLLAADQAQPPAAVTPNVTSSPAAATDLRCGATVYVQVGVGLGGPGFGVGAGVGGVGVGAGPGGI